MYLDKAGVKSFKNHCYRLEGWNEKNGWPTRKILEGLGLNKIADTMVSKGNLGA
jgi:aldehyde:ferredoxin oxidoreductase